ncbi:MAG: hypothetical protein JWM63_3186 [Gammaproteobacteria bacterium]|jgi:hypothetical protein|nr:hypothetical protein [Gammaproteobacteria bacterium]
MNVRYMKTLAARRRKVPPLALQAGLAALASLGIAGVASHAFAAGAHPNPTAEQDEATVRNRGDVVKLPAALRKALGEIAERPHSFLPVQAFNEADGPSQLFQYYLLNTKEFQPNEFTAIIPGVNDGAIPTAANAANGQEQTIGAVRVVLEPKPGLPTDPGNVGSFIDIFTDISGLFVINNESGWYEGWMLHDLVVPQVAPPRQDGHAAFGSMSAADAAAVAKLGDHRDVPGAIFTMDGKDVHFPKASDHFPDMQTNVVPVFLSMGAYNCLQQSDCHAYWEFNQYTDWVFPGYELPSTGGVPGTFAAGLQYDVQSLIPGSGPAGVSNSQVPLKLVYGDDPNHPRDPDRGANASPTDPDRPTANIDDQKEKRLRFIPSGLANEILLDVYVRLSSFEPGVQDLSKRLFDAYAAEVARVDSNSDGVITFVEADFEGTSDNGQPNSRLFIPATQFNRFAVTREINDGLLAPRFAPSQRGYVLSGSITKVSPSVPASTGRDGDDR